MILSDVDFEKRGSVGLVLLNRAKALNALTIEMIKALSAQLEAWKTDDDVKAVILTSTSERAFSAGADIRFVYNNRANPPYEFFRVEYLMNCAMKRYPKPYISLIDGIVMGGGVGLSFHGKYVAVGSKTMFAMPETGIGFFPDVGGAYLLPRMPGKLGIYCGLTGGRLGHADCLRSGLATHCIEPDHFPTIIEEIARGRDPEETLQAYTSPPQGTGLDDVALQIIEEAFSGNSVSEIIARLQAMAQPFAKQTLDMMLSRSPISVHIAFEQMKRGREMEFEECMQMEYRILEHILKGSDFYEGVRATIVDKDGAPDWQPSSFGDVADEAVLSHFMPLEAERELFKAR